MFPARTRTLARRFFERRLRYLDVRKSMDEHSTSNLSKPSGICIHVPTHARIHTYLKRRLRQLDAHRSIHKHRQCKLPLQMIRRMLPHDGQKVSQVRLLSVWGFALLVGKKCDVILESLRMHEHHVIKLLDLKSPRTYVRRVPESYRLVSLRTCKYHMHCK